MSNFAKSARLGLAALAAATVTALPATAHAQARPFIYPSVTVKLAHTGVKEPGKLSLTVHASTCVADVQATAVDEQTLAVVRSSTVTSRGEVFTLTYTFSKSSPAGTWVVGDVYGRPCTATRGQEAFNSSVGYFPSFRVVR